MPGVLEEKLHSIIILYNSKERIEKRACAHPPEAGPEGAEEIEPKE